MASPSPQAALPASSSRHRSHAPPQDPPSPAHSASPRLPRRAHQSDPASGGPGARRGPGRRGAVVAHAGCRLVGVGSSVPDAVLTNHDLEEFIDTSDEWISRRTGIRQRHVMGGADSLAGHGAAAASRALEMAEMAGGELDMVILATSSPDDIFGSACQVQASIGATKAVAFDITAACSGFVVGMVTGAQYIRTGMCKHVLVVGADALSRVLDWRDRSTCILFGDGCGAVVLSPSDDDNCSLLGMAMVSDGTGQKSLNAEFQAFNGIKARDGGASSPAAFSNIQMNGQEVFKWAVRGVPKIIEEALEKGGLTSEDIDWLVMHQANMRILSAAAERLGLPQERVVSNLQKYGNTSAASIPLALDEAVRNSSIKSGDVIAMAGFGAGLTMAAAIVKWG
ncbi:unnamed protein product [Ostreobium quekettii]|uniref:beta-ketoacyl-[acyl-carrier-protein] synthase III n=1 Tax=Ostreobium quekettii TaxID=121088 RepID=A0A8S1IWR9_9CHLO|nr:unnamed protein product [Ostreobium quekettii]|eukprot:evm.model.scf_40.13 EVM.evm.TU.scf_40.13   scf_40:101185-106862(+)